MHSMSRFLITAMTAATFVTAPAFAEELSDEDLENLVRRSYQYVAMYNVNNKIALKQGGWNTVEADTELKDHTMKDIARPNNDTLYITAIIDLRKDPVILAGPVVPARFCRRLRPFARGYHL